ncbi:N-acetylmuramoyl-L-alanine amidase [Actinomycetospora aeridis]|uniref:N-acetylmuramoyl-L-alanine amidase n=1 Tax=Actinomycetospora aeridis TaxID=3129231 RepID=A0ABU8NAY9_9PSEU
MPTIDRRQLLIASFAAATATAVGVGASPATARTAPPLQGLGVRPRATWARAAPRGPLLPEPEVRFLLVHHTATANGYAREEVPGLLDGVRRFHTSPDKGWHDVAYNFFVDRFGDVWEGRAGSLLGPVRADATGGNQGYAQLCCFLGDHQREAPAPAAVESMTALLAALADRHAIDTTPGATATFVSRGSNRRPAGETVDIRTIAGHRDVSATECPGDRAYELLDEVLPAAVNARRAAAPVAPAAPAAPLPTSSPALPGPAEDAVPTATTVAGAALGAAAVALGMIALRRRR